MKKINTRASSYKEMRELDMSPEFCVNLSKLRDKCIKRGKFEDTIKIKSKNKKIERLLISLFKNTLNFKFNLKIWARELIKYGDFFVYLKFSKEKGIYDFMIFPVEEIHREEGFDGNKNAVRFKWESTNEYFEDWQLVHFRTIENTGTLPYGRPVFNSKGKLKGEERCVVEDIKEALEIGLEKIAKNHIYLLGHKKDVDNFYINLN